MSNETTTSVYATREQIEGYIQALPAVIIASTVSTLTETDLGYNRALAGMEQFEAEVYVYCTKADDEADYQWWEQGLSELAAKDGLDTYHVSFTIYPDDENNPNAEDEGGTED